jgi:CRP/FNR family transcriptional regulator, cyclic AMP receptor protein
MPALSTEALVEQLAARGLQPAGLCSDLSGQLPAFRQSQLLEDFSAQELDILGSVMPRLQATAGQVLIAEGEAGDWMMLVITGTVDVTKQVLLPGESATASTEVSRLAVVTSGATLGEMSMFDNEPRNASCVAITDANLGLLTRSAIARLIAEHPAVAAKLLAKITQLLAQRLRNASAKLIRNVIETRQQMLFR